MKFAFVKEHRGTWPVGAICDVLGVARSGYYAWARRGPSARQRRRDELAAKVKAVHGENRGVYGSPRVYQVLKARGEAACENTVAKVMREHGVRARAKRKFVPRTTDSAHASPVAANALVNALGRDFSADAPDLKWAADITYVPTGEGWLYLAGVIDLCTRRVVGWAMADHMRADLVIDALGMALARRDPGPGLLHHSDRGSQYAGGDYQRVLAEHGITCSMSRAGDCWDNAVMESFWATLKTELVHLQEFPTRAAARAAIFEYVEVFYNRQRLHSSLGYLSPEQFEASLN